MPELPDVEVYKRYIDATSLHRRIEHLHLEDESLLEGASRQKLVSALVGAELKRSRRHGKFLGVRSSRGSWLLLHFGMTGNLLYRKSEAGMPEHTALALDFHDAMRLNYTNARRLGMIGLTPDFGVFIEEKALGPDALELEREEFCDLISARRGAIKSLLMNQKAVAGLGNEYADEALYHARIRPDRPLDGLSRDEAVSLYARIHRVLNTAIDRNADPERMPRTWLRPRRKEGLSCPRCGAKISRMKVSGRSTYWCPGCQR